MRIIQFFPRRKSQHRYADIERAPLRFIAAAFAVPHQQCIAGGTEIRKRITAIMFFANFDLGERSIFLSHTFSAFWL